jgi:shikimate dehydrogenase
MIRPVQKDLYAVIGNPVEHSLSPVMMNAVFDALDIPAVYFALRVDDLPDDLVTLAKFGIRGLSVTIPHKEIAYHLAQRLDEASQTMGAVNTLRLDDMRWEGRNTDWIGAINAMINRMDRFESCHHGEFSPANHDKSSPRINAPTRRQTHDTPPFPAGKRALVVGAGGVARAVVYGLKCKGAAVAISNRGIERGETLAKNFGCDFISPSELREPGSKAVFDIIVQCTSVGLAAGSTVVTGQEQQAKRREPREDFTLIPDSLFRPGTLVMDTVYRPLRTPFLRKAETAGCLTVSGLEMLLLQGAAQLEWWFGESIRTEVVVPIMRKAIMRVLEDE